MAVLSLENHAIILPFSASKKTLVSKIFRGAASCELISRAPAAPPPAPAPILLQFLTTMAVHPEPSRRLPSVRTQKRFCRRKDVLAPLSVCKRNRCAGPISSGRLADLSFPRGVLFWFDIEPEFHFLGHPPDCGETEQFPGPGTRWFLRKSTSIRTPIRRLSSVRIPKRFCRRVDLLRED